MTHSEMDELYELYLLGALEVDQAHEISDHLSQQCEYCLAHLKESSRVVESLSGLVELHAPPAHLRERVLAIAAPKQLKLKRNPWPLAFAFAAAAAIALVFWGIGQSNRLNELTRQRNELRGALAILSESDTRTVSFGKAPADPQGRVFVSRNGGVVFLGNRLPQLTAGKTFEFWLVPAKGNPQPAGLFKTNAQGIAVNVLAQSINPSDYAAVAVSIEPNGGSPQPTSTPILIVPLA
jgi:anti-sigma-K factor RskA